MDTDTHTRSTAREEESRDWGDAAEAKEHKRWPENFEKPGKGHGMGSPSQSQKEPAL